MDLESSLSRGGTFYFSVPFSESSTISMFAWGARAPYQHSPVQRSVPHCVTSSVSVIHPAGDSTPASVQPAKFKYTGNELLALAAPVGQRLKPELISTLKMLGIGPRLPRRRLCRGGARN